jgi:hypothetical protein
MAGPFVVSTGCIAAAAGVPLLWLAWNKPPGSKALARAAGWLLILAAVALLGATSGAWGVAVSATVTSAAALLVLAYVAATSAPKQASVREAPHHDLDVRKIFSELPRRIAVFLLAVPGGLFASTLLTFGARAAARHAGWPESDSTMLALGGLPLAWSIIASLQMMQSSLATMAATIVVPAVCGGLLGLFA